MMFRGVEFQGRLPATQADLDHAEHTLGTELPADVAEFFHVVNGGECLHEVQLPDRPLPVTFSWWHPLDEALEARAGLEEAYFRSLLPDQFLPVAETGGEDDVLLVDLSPGAHGGVLAWITGRPPGWRRPTEDALLWLAADLSALLRGMLPPEE